MSQAKQEENDVFMDDDEQEVVETVEENEGGYPEEKARAEESPEEKARALGWKPKAEYKGSQENWVDFGEFIKRSEEDPHEVRKANHILLRKVQKLERGYDDLLSHQNRVIEETRRQSYAEAKEKLKHEYDRALEDGDVTKAKKLFDANEELTQRQIVEKPVDGEILGSWIEKNPWYGKNFRATKAAEEYEDWLAKRGVPLAERLVKTEEYIKDEVIGRRNEAPATVRGGGSNSRLKDKAVKPGTYEALTSKARAACDRIVRESNGRITKESWVQYATPDLFQQ